MIRSGAYSKHASAIHACLRSTASPFLEACQPSRSHATDSNPIGNTNVKVDTPPPPSQTDFTFSGGKGVDGTNERGTPPSFDSPPVGPSTEEIGGRATIGSTNMKVETAAPESGSAFEEGSAAKVFVPSGTAASLEEEDGSHHEENKAKVGATPVSGEGEGKIDPPGVHSGP